MSMIVGKIPTRIWHLEMFSPPSWPALQPPVRELEIVRALDPTLRFYRYLYDNVGGDWLWCSRRIKTDGELASEIGRDSVDLRILWLAGVPAGYAEIDFRSPDDVELLYFGLMPEAIGCGFGRYFLDWSIRHAFAVGASRFWVHTCDLDHPRAKEVYERGGFQLFDQEDTHEIILEGMPIPAHAANRPVTPVD